jgi:DNA-directed RNA polymerase subunit RPC12/RpoP
MKPVAMSADPRSSSPPMMVVTCGSCGSKLRTPVPDEPKMARCPKCGSRLRIEPPTVSMSDEDVQVVEQPAAKTVETPIPTPVPTPPARQPVAAEPKPEPASERPPALKTEWISASKAEWESERDWDNEEKSDSADASTEVPAENPEAAEPRRRPENLLKSFILLMGGCVIAAFAWYALVRYGGEQEWIVKRSAGAWLVGMMTATVMLSAGRHRAGGKIASALAAIFAIVLGHALVLALTTPALPLNLQACVQLLVTSNHFDKMLPIAVALAAAGSTARFIIASPE